MKVADVVPSSRVRHSLGFDEVAIVPANVTIDPEDADTSWRVGQFTFAIPFIAAAMDGAVDPAFAIALGKAGGLAVLNLEGLQTRYDHPEEALQAITKASPAGATAVLQQVYRQPVQERLIEERISEIKRSGVAVAASATPAMADVHGPIAVEAGLDIFVVQSTVTTARHRSSSRPQLSLERLRRELEIPIVVGNCVSYQAAYELMETGIDGVLVGVGPGAACTSREVLGIGVPQVTATMETSAARDAYFQATGRYVPIITDGGMRTGGDICKSFASGADAVMLGSIFAQALEAPGAKASPEPGYGYHWGMA
ncbi:MAG: GuaB3 family IMP dehydrogenase-related protein, partial [Chloroflexi bacterium]|nr:GuaB3 family IMP dehydrogenase-related protein [Chloroflexota bacterium]